MYEYESGVIPDLPEDYTVPENATDVQLLEQTIHNQEKIIEFMYYELKKDQEDDLQQAEDQELVHNNSSMVIEKLQTLIDQSSTGDSALADSNTQVLQKLDHLDHSVQVGSNTVLTYGTLYIPLAIIVFLLYRFFWSFLRPLR